MDEIENLLDSLKIAIQNEKFYHSYLEDKNRRLLMKNERLMEAGIHAQLGLWTAWFDLA